MRFMYDFFSYPTVQCPLQCIVAHIRMGFQYVLFKKMGFIKIVDIGIVLPVTSAFDFNTLPVELNDMLIIAI